MVLHIFIPTNEKFMREVKPPRRKKGNLRLHPIRVWHIACSMRPEYPSLTSMKFATIKIFNEL